MKNNTPKLALRPSLGGGPAMVAFLFGVAGRSELPRTALTQLLVDVGLSVPAAHALLTRMRRRGLLGSTRRGRDADYRLAGTFAEGFQRVLEFGSARPAEWTGAFNAVLYQVPERHRSFRDALRRTALLSGYGLVQDGVLIALNDRHAAIAGMLEGRPDGARVIVGELAMEAGEAALCAFDAWDLGELRRTYRAHIDDMERALSEQFEAPSASAHTLRRYADLARAPLTDTLRDPGLPKALLPDDWPGDRLQQLIGRVHATFGQAAHDHVVNVLARRGRP